MTLLLNQIKIIQEIDTFSFICVIEERNFNKCATNLIDRLTAINNYIEQKVASQQKFNEPLEAWKNASCVKSFKANAYCLCGHKIKTVYNICILEHFTIQLGRNCIERFFPSLKNEINIEKRYCRICNKKVKDNLDYCTACKITKNCKQCNESFRILKRMEWYIQYCTKCSR